MRYSVTIRAVLGIAGTVVATTVKAQAPPRQLIHLVGRVVDERRSPVEGVEVIINRREIRARTDSAGIFTLEASRTDSTIGFRRIGYQPLLATVHPLPRPGDTVLVRLVTSPVTLSEVIISASPSKPLRYAGTTKYDDVFLRRRIGFGTLITREEIDRRVVVATHELLEGTPGVRIWNGPPKRIRFIRCEDPGGIVIYIDGMRQVAAALSPDRDPRTFAGIPKRQTTSTVEDEPDIEILSRVNPSDVEMIEVYGGASEIPGAFHWNGCAVVAIWTRWNR